MIQNKVSIIAKAPFWLGVNEKTCWKCSNVTQVISLASNNFLIYDYVDDEEELKEWIFQDYFSFFNTPTYIEKSVLDIICQRFPFFKLGYSNTLNSKYWANHCKYCNALQGDFYMHGEPEGEFWPMNMAEYKAITLLEIPYKFDLMINAEYSCVSNEKEIFKYCNKAKW